MPLIILFQKYRVGVNSMPYYLKISYNGKTKKFIVRNPKEISLSQIKKTFVPAIPQQIRLSFDICYRTEEVVTVKSQQQIMEYFINREFGQGQSVKIVASELAQNNEENSDQQFYQHFLQTGQITKNRSHSQQLDSNLLTNEFVVRSAEQSLYQSMRLSSSLMSEAEDYIRDKEKKLMKLKEEKRETNIMELLDFLYRKKS